MAKHPRTQSCVPHHATQRIKRVRFFLLWPLDWLYATFHFQEPRSDSQHQSQGPPRWNTPWTSLSDRTVLLHQGAKPASAQADAFSTKQTHTHAITAICLPRAPQAGVDFQHRIWSGYVHPSALAARRQPRYLRYIFHALTIETDLNRSATLPFSSRPESHFALFSFFSADSWGLCASRRDNIHLRNRGLSKSLVHLALRFTPHC